MSLLTIVRDAWARLGMGDSVPSAVMTSSDASVAVMRALATQEGRELAKRGAWQRLVREHSFTTVAQTEQTGGVPTDFDRLLPGTVWNYTQREEIVGPLTAEEWQQLSASVVGPPDLHFRIRGNAFLIIPNPPADETVKFEYVSSYWVDADNDGTGDATAWATDTDSTVLDEELITKGIIWRWLKSRRMPFADELAEYNEQVAAALGRDGGKRTINMGGARRGLNPRVPGIADGSWSL
jgi:hypothetical protein